MLSLPGTTDRRIDALLTLLTDNATIVISGEKIAREVGVTRHTVWRWMEKLRDLGVKVKGHPRTGYQLQTIPDVLAPQMLRRRLTGLPHFKRIHHFFKTESTNTLGMQAGHAGEPHGTLLIAEEQTAGRGRAGRKWISEKSSSIHVTVLLRPKLSPMLAPVVTIAAGLAVRDAIFEQTSLRPDLRWPNDVLLGGRKIAGILTEMHAEPDRVRFVIVGIGVNVNQARMPEEITAVATSLRMETGRQHARIELLARLLRALDRYYNQLMSQGAAPILQRFGEVSSYACGKRVRISNGKEVYTGTTAGLEPSGLLRVERDAGGIEVIISGDVAEA